MRWTPILALVLAFPRNPVSVSARSWVIRRRRDERRRPNEQRVRRTWAGGTEYTATRITGKQGDEGCPSRASLFAGTSGGRCAQNCSGRTLFWWLAHSTHG